MGRKEDLGFYWIATLDDDSVIEQFNPDGSENLYKLVDDNYDNLVSFKITNGDDVYEIDMVKWKLKTPTKTYNPKGLTPKLIYFRRNQVRMEVGGTNRDLLFPRVVHHIGIDTDDEDIKMEVFNGQGVKPKSKKFDKKNKK